LKIEVEVDRLDETDVRVFERITTLCCSSHRRKKNDAPCRYRRVHTVCREHPSSGEFLEQEFCAADR